LQSLLLGDRFVISRLSIPTAWRMGNSAESVKYVRDTRSVKPPAYRISHEGEIGRLAAIIKEKAMAHYSLGWSWNTSMLLSPDY
jgi:hypothetical protein